MDFRLLGFAFALLFLIFVALRLNIPALGEQPRRSKMRWLEEWQTLLQLGARECFLASCMFGSPNRRSLPSRNVQPLSVGDHPGANKFHVINVSNFSPYPVVICQNGSLVRNTNTASVRLITAGFLSLH